MVYGVLASWIKELLKDKEGLVPGIKNITSFACLVRPGLKNVFQWKAEFCIFIKPLFSLEAETLALFTTETRGISSANN